jgi:hypothetical protein
MKNGHYQGIFFNVYGHYQGNIFLVMVAIIRATFLT